MVACLSLPHGSAATEAGTLVWPNDADFDPSTLHDWPNV
jgi:hypothetical protein